MKINNKQYLSKLQLTQADNIWQMTREELQDYTAGLWDNIPNNVSEELDNLELIFGEEFWLEIEKRLRQLDKDEERAQYATITINNEAYETITYFDMYHLGWECDTKGFVVKTATGPKFVLTNHGTYSFVSEEVIKNKIKELNGAVKAMKSALTVVELG